MRLPGDMHRGDLEATLPGAPCLQRGARHLKLCGGLALGEPVRLQVVTYLKEFCTPEIILAHGSRAAKTGPLHELFTDPVPVPASGPLVPVPLSALTRPAR